MKNLFQIAQTVTSVAFLPLFIAGCSQNAVRIKNSAMAPSLSDGSQAHIRGVSDPNAPFTLLDRNKTSAKQAFSDDESGAGTCRPSNLQVYEAAASMNGDSRVVRLAFKNRGTATCRLSGYPAIELDNEKGTAIANIAVRQIGGTSLSGNVTTPVRETAAVSVGVSQAVDVVLRPSAEASFEIGWSSGDGCPLVSRIVIALPATTANAAGNAALAGSFAVNHPLNVCNGEIRMTALSAGTMI
jgi:hypothetical protein